MLAYLDHHATTPCDRAVQEAMAPWWSERWANPSSRLYRPALEAAAAVEHGRERVAALLEAPDETRVVFTSGATEANNLALKGVAEAAVTGDCQRRRLVSVVTEHRSVLDPLRHLERFGLPLTLLPVAPDGLVELTALETALASEDVLLVSVMAANNEIGVLQPLAAIAERCHRHGALLHCDAAQAAGHVPLAMDAQGIDLLSISAHKLYGPVGSGALLVRPEVSLAPQQLGGGQEGGLRAGTLAAPLILGLARALELACADREERALRLGDLREQLWQGLEALGEVQRNGAAAPRLPHNLNVTIGGVDGTALHQQLRRRIAVSSGSACSHGSPSHVLKAIGRSRQEAAASIRFGLGRHTTEAEINGAIAAVRDAVQTLRR
jgi:cysteine desulfurase